MQGQAVAVLAHRRVQDWHTGPSAEQGSLAQGWHRARRSAQAGEEQLTVAASLQKMSKHIWWGLPLLPAR